MKKYILMGPLLMNFLTPAFVEAIPNTHEEKVLFDSSSIKEGTSQSIKLKKIIENSFKVVTDMTATDEDYAQYISKDYVQYVDGETLNYEGFIDHMKAIKKSVKSIKILFHDMIVEGNKVATRHTAYAIKKDNTEIEVQVIAIFDIKDEKIISCNELTYMVKGEKSDRDLGSRR